MIEFQKMQGAGNDFVVLGDVDDQWRISPAAARALCDRKFGVGADALIRIVAAGDHFEMDYLNADGSGSEMCGNGLRVVGKWLGDRGIVGSEVGIVTAGSVKHLQLWRSSGASDAPVESVTVNMGPAEFLDNQSIVVSTSLADFDVTRVITGNPHAVLFDDDVANFDLAVHGPNIQSCAEYFPQGVNVEVVQLLDPNTVVARVFERGVGETLACGSGATAIAACQWRRGAAGPIAVRLPGGELGFELRGLDIHMTGPAVEVFTGHLEPSRFGLIPNP